MKKAVSRTMTLNSSGALISGVPTLVAYYQEYVNNIQHYIRDAAEVAVRKYEDTLQTDAQVRGWGEDASTISVSLDPKRLQIQISGSADREYGTGSEPPRPVIRGAIARVKDLEDSIERELKRRAL